MQFWLEIAVSLFFCRPPRGDNSYGQVKPGEQYSYLAKLVRGMPKRLQKCRAILFGRCGK